MKSKKKKSKNNRIYKTISSLFILVLLSGAREDVYRMLRLWDKHNIKVTSHVVGEAAIKYPKVAKAIANSGHEIAAHGIA